MNPILLPVSTKWRQLNQIPIASYALQFLWHIHWFHPWHPPTAPPPPVWAPQLPPYSFMIYIFLQSYSTMIFFKKKMFQIWCFSPLKLKIWCWIAYLQCTWHENIHGGYIYYVQIEHATFRNLMSVISHLCT